jgi:hypothetical protein
MNKLILSIWPLWLELGRARAEALEFDVQPWETNSDLVKIAWSQLIRPNNLAALEEMLRDSSTLNPSAHQVAQMAVQICRKHKGTDNTSQ